MKQLKNFSLLLVAVLVMFTSCKDEDEKFDIEYAKAIPSVEKTLIGVGEEIEIEFSSSAYDFSYDITQGSENIEVFEQDDTYYIKGTEAGTATITLNNNEGTSELTITVGLPPIIDIDILAVNDTVLISNTGMDDGFSYTITQGGECVEIVEIEGMQYVVGLKEGTATITLTNNFGSSEHSITVGLLPSVDTTNVLVGDSILISNTGMDGEFSYEITQDDDYIKIGEGDDGMQYIVGLKVGTATVTFTNNFGTSTETITVSDVYFNDDYYVDLQGVLYNINTTDNTASVAGAPEGTNVGANYGVDFTESENGVLTIPANIYYEGKEYPVESIENYAFYDESNTKGNPTIVGLKFAEGSALITIGDYAFNNCDELTDLDFTPCSSLTTIGSSAFLGCGNVVSINFAECASLTTIGKFAFQGCGTLSSLTFTDCTSLIKIGEFAFRYCGDLIDVDLTSCTSLNTVGGNAFADCNNDITIELPGDATDWNQATNEINSGNWTQDFTRTIN